MPPAATRTVTALQQRGALWNHICFSRQACTPATPRRTASAPASAPPASASLGPPPPPFPTTTQAWVLNGSLLENVLMGEPLDEARWELCVEVGRGRRGGGAGGRAGGQWEEDARVCARAGAPCVHGGQWVGRAGGLGAEVGWASVGAGGGGAGRATGMCGSRHRGECRQGWTCVGGRGVWGDGSAYRTAHHPLRHPTYVQLEPHEGHNVAVPPDYD